MPCIIKNSRVYNIHSPNAIISFFNSLGEKFGREIISTSKEEFDAVMNSEAAFQERGAAINYDTDKVARERFDIQALTRIGQGSDRTVFQLDNNRVLKVAHTARGLAQNRYEGDYYLTSVVPEVYERGLNYVVAQETPRAKSADVITIYNEDGDDTGTSTFGTMIKDLARFSQRDFDLKEDGLQDALVKYGLSDITSYDVIWLDFVAPRNWGMLDGVPLHLDGGTFGGVRMLDEYRGKTNMEDEDFRDVYNKSRQAKKEYNDKDKFTMFQKGSVVYGAYQAGKIYLNPDVINSNTIFHELGHLQYALLEKAASLGDAKAQNILETGRELLTPLATKWKAVLDGEDLIEQNTTTQEFKTWYSDSVVKTEDGKPLIVYHASKERINVFEEATSPSGFWFATSKQDVENFAENRREPGTSQSVYLSIKNPKIYETQQEYLDAKDALGSRELLKNSLKEQGYDGIHIKQKDWFQNSDSEQYVAFDSSQIKETTNTTFDPNNKDIRFEAPSLAKVYKKRRDESDDEHLERLIDETRSDILGKYGEKRMASIATSPSVLAELKKWVQSVYDLIAQKLGLKDTEAKTITELIDASFNSLFKGDYFEYLNQLEKTPLKPRQELSVLYENIAINPHVTDPQTLFLHTFSEKFKEKFGEWDQSKTSSPLHYESGEPKLFYLTPNNTAYESFALALENTTEGNIVMGFISGQDVKEYFNEDLFNNSLADVSIFKGKAVLLTGEFIPVYEISAESSPTNRTGAINKYIREGLISPTRKLVNDTYRLRGKGAQDTFAVMATTLLENEILRDLGRGVFTNFGDGTFDIKEINNDEIFITAKVGTTRAFSKNAIREQLKQGKYAELNARFEAFPAVVYELFREENEIYGTPSTRIEIKEEELINKLLKLLNNLGISVVTLTDYVQKYKQRHGTDISVDALADLSNSVVAFAEGKMNVNNLSEETAHIIIEAHKDQAEIDALLDEVQTHPLWNQYSDEYYKRYAALYPNSQEDLDKAVKREILGKILSESIQTEFNSPDTLIQKLKEIFSKFLQTIRAYFLPSHKTSLDIYIESATQIALQNNTELLDTNIMHQSTMLMYNTGNSPSIAQIVAYKQKLVVQIQKAVQDLEVRTSALNKQRDPMLSTMKAEIKRINKEVAQMSKDINAAESTNAIQIITSVNDAQIKHLQRQLAVYKKKADGSYFNHADQSTYSYLKNTALHQLVTLKTLYASIPATSDVLKAKLLKTIDSQMVAIKDLEGDVFVQGTKDFDVLFNRLTFEYGMDQAAIDKVRAMFEAERDDISAFQALFGQLEHASNPVLNLLGKMISSNGHRAMQDTLYDMKPVLMKAKAKGWNLKAMQSLVEKDKEGKQTGYVISAFNFPKFEKAKKEHQETLFKSLLPQGTEFTEIDLSILSETSQNTYYAEMEKWKSANTERLFTDEYYKQKEQRYQDAGVSIALRTFLTNLSVRRAGILDKYRRSMDTIDYSQISEEDIEDLNRIVLERKAKKSLYNADTGELKDGEELEEAKQLKALDALSSKAKRNVKQEFFDALKDREKISPEEGVKFMKANGGITFSARFWDALTKDSVDALTRMEDLALSIQSQDPEDATRLIEAANKMSELIEGRKEILRQHTASNSPAEVQYDLMGDSARENLREKESRIQELYIGINDLLRKHNKQELPKVETENTLNEAYHLALADYNGEETSFIKEHLSRINQAKYTEFERRLNIIQNTPRDFIESEYSKFIFNKFGMDAKEAIAAHGIETVLAEYGRPMVFSYFKRFAPKGYDVLMQGLNNGASVVSVVEAIQQAAADPVYDPTNIFHNLEISTKFEWVEDEVGESFRNDDYDKDFDGGFEQPKLSLYQNAEYFNRFGIDANGKATRDLNNFELLQELKGIMKKSLELYGEEGRNVNKLPMKSKSANERAIGFSVSNSIEAIKDTVFKRVDDMNYGATTAKGDVRDFSSVKLIPKYYLTELENLDNISNDLLSSYAEMLHSANVYTQRHNTITDVAILEQKLVHTPFKNGKAPDVTNTMKMFREFVDAYYYGIRITAKRVYTLPNGKEIDLSKWATKFDNFVRRINIGFNVPVAVSSALVSNVNLAIENRVGEYVNTHSSRWASKEMALLLPSFTQASGDYARKDKLYLLGETFGLYDNRTRNVGSNRMLRAASNLPFALMRMAATPHSNTVMLSVLDDFRFVDDKFLRYEDFVKRSDNMGLDKKSLLERWDKYRVSSMYNLLEADADGRMAFKAGIAASPEYLEAALTRASLLIQRTNGNIDMFTSAEDKSAASRHSLFRFFTAHRDWLTLSIQRRFKRNHYNYSTGQIEEGHYVSAKKFSEALFSLARKEGATKFFTEFMTTFHSMSETEQKNLGRVMKDLTAFMILTLLAIPIAAAADDEENKDVWPIQFLSFLYFRTTVEQGSAQLPFGAFNLVDMVKTPFVAVNALSSLTDSKGWSTQEVTSGPYEGFSKWQKTLAKQTYLRHYYDMIGIRQKSDYYRLMNGESLFMIEKESKKEQREKKKEEYQSNMIKENLYK